MKDIKNIQEFISKSLKEYRQSSQATRDSWLRTQKPERFLILDPDGNALSTPLGKLKTDASIRALHTRLRRDKDGWFINDYKNTPLAIYDTKNNEVVEVMYRDDNNYWQFAFNIDSLGDNKQFAYMFDVTPKNLDNQNETMNDIKKIQEFFSKSLKEIEVGDSIDAIFRKYAGKTIEMEFDDPQSDWANLLNDLGEILPEDKLSDFMSSGEADLYLDDYNITLIDPFMDREVDLDILKRGKAKMDIDKMRYDAGMPPLDSIAGLNEDQEDVQNSMSKILDLLKDESRRLNDDDSYELGLKLKAWFEKNILKENTFKKGDKVTYLDYPAEITSVEDRFGKTYLSISYDKGEGKTKARGILSTDGSVKPLKEGEKSFADYTNQELAAYVKNTKDKEAAKELHKRSQKLKNLSRTDVKEDQDINDPVMMRMRAAKDKLAKMRAANAGDDGNDHIFRAAANKAKKLAALKAKRAEIMRDMEQEAEPEGGPIADKYGAELNKIDKAITKLSGQGEWGPEKDTNISRDEIERRAAMLNPVDTEIAKRAAMFGLEEELNEGGIEDIQKKLDALGVKYEMSKTDKVRPFKAIYKPVNKSDEFYDKFEDIVDLFNLKGFVKTAMNEAKEEDKVDTITMDIPLFLRMLEYSREDAEQDLDLHDVTEKANKLGKERGILQMDDYEEIVGAAEEIKEIEDDKFKNDPWKGGPEYKEEDLLAQKIFGIKYFGWLDSWEQSHLVNKYNLDKNIITKEGKEVNLKQSKLSSAEYQKAKKLKDFKASDWKWNADEDLYTKVNEGELTEAYVPSNIKEFAKRKGVSSLVNKVAGWAEKVGKGIRGGTAIGYNYSTLILDMTYQGSEIRINTDDDTIELYDEPVSSFPEFKQVYLDNQDIEENVAPNHNGKAAPFGSGYKPLEERIAKALKSINEELCPAGKAYIKRRKAAGEKSSAYLSGRAVKVCKGQMSGKSKKK